MTLHVLSAQTQQDCYVVDAGPFKLSHQAYPSPGYRIHQNSENARTNKEQSSSESPKNLECWCCIVDSRDYEISTSQSCAATSDDKSIHDALRGRRWRGQCSSLSRAPKLRNVAQGSRGFGMGSNIGRHQTLQSEDRLFSCQIRDTTAIQADPRPTNWVALGAKTPWPLPPIAMLTRGVFPSLGFGGLAGVDVRGGLNGRVVYVVTKALASSPSDLFSSLVLLTCVISYCSCTMTTDTTATPPSEQEKPTAVDVENVASTTLSNLPSLTLMRARVKRNDARL
ncbi:Uncharacterized protein HZ326_8499 [Fusarium oxysporum f. sp. albedinis]|nr:Uncharacterized protein HZ326_8499 [Fusarium oxysporum f. sp. albedinis]